MSAEYPTLANSGTAQKPAIENPITQVSTTGLTPLFQMRIGMDATMIARVVIRWVRAVSARTRPANGTSFRSSRTILMSNPRYTRAKANDHEKENSPARVEGMFPP